MQRIDLKTYPVRLSTVLIHGIYAVGKTTLLGSAMAEESQYGKCACLIIGSEPSLNTLRRFDFNDNVEIYLIETYEDLLTFLKEQKGKPKYHCVVVDSLASLNELAELAETGGVRAPGGGKSGESTGGMAEWGRIKFLIESGIEGLKRISDIFIASCPSERKENDVNKEKYIATELIGKLGTRIAHRFDFVGYWEMVVVNATTQQRMISFHSRGDALTRCNAPKSPTRAIPITHPETCWLTIKTVLLKCLGVTE